MILPDTLVSTPVSRRSMLQSLGAVGLFTGVQHLLPDYSGPRPTATGGAPLAPRIVDGKAIYDLEIAETKLRIEGRSTTATTINGTVPGPLIRLREGDDAILRVTNRLREDTSIHWHGLILPPEMDGVPGLSFPGIRPGETFEYRYPVQQAGTYWYHSHSGLQEQLGHYGPLVIDPAEPLPYAYDREFVLVLSDWTFENPYRLLERLKKQPDYYNYQRRTLMDFFRDVGRDGFGTTVRDRLMWSSMRMNPTDISDVTGATYSFLMNGMAPETNWTGLFKPGERVLLRVINAGAGSYFDVRVPGVPMTVVQVSGQPVEPVETDEFRIALAETYDVIVQLPEDRAYTIFAEAMDRSGFASGTLAPREGMVGALPPRRRRPTLTMNDMGMDHGSMAGMDHANMPGMDAPAAAPVATPAAAVPDEHAGHDMSAMGGGTPAAGLRAPGTLPERVAHGPDSHGPGNAMAPEMVSSRLSEPGVGLGEDGRRVLLYTQLRSLAPREDFKAPDREIELHLTGNMERFMWGIDGVPFHEAEPIEFTYGERLRLTMVNDTMMNHPMHLHGMWMELENGQGDRIPRVHTINVKPAEKVSLLITADAPGRWAFHCHVLYHMEVGMFRIVQVSADPHAGHHDAN
ncbi:MAG: copper resistance system multicopper oxidase [Gemmatimonadales bacterium]|nr:copper resistance system multicopper oxidase [Gemmatimonadota bacterium]MCL4214108.1 copper resistance system multicopper oxidase [Gemmatimonadales bacterium]